MPCWKGRSRWWKRLGEVTNLYVQIDGVEDPLVAKVTGTTNHKRGQRVGLTAPANIMHLFNEQGRSLLYT